MFLVLNLAFIPRKYLPASRVFLFHNTRLLSPDHVRCTIIKISIADISLPRSKIFSPHAISPNPPPPHHTPPPQNLLGGPHPPTHTPALEPLAMSPPPLPPPP